MIQQVKSLINSKFATPAISALLSVAQSQFNEYVRNDNKVDREMVEDAFVNLVGAYSKELKKNKEEKKMRRGYRDDGVRATELIEDILNAVELDPDLVRVLSRSSGERNSETAKDKLLTQIVQDAVEKILDVSAEGDSRGYRHIIDDLEDGRYEVERYGRRRDDNRSYDRDDRETRRSSRAAAKDYDSLIAAIEKYMKDNNVPFPESVGAFKNMFVRAKNVTKNTDMIAFKGSVKDLYDAMRK